MMKTCKSVAAAAVVALATANAALATNEYHLLCYGPNNSGWGKMLGSISPNQYDTLAYNLCGYTVYLSPVMADRLNQCTSEWRIQVKMYWHNDYDTRLCTIGG